MDRRTFMTTAVCVPGAVVAAWPWLACFAARRHTVAVIDSTLASGAAFAGYAAQCSLTVLEAGDDIGALWYTTLVPLLRAAPGPAFAPASLIGLTRSSDYFVLERLATGAGHRVEHCDARGAGQGSGSGPWLVQVAFAFGPRTPG